MDEESFNRTERERMKTFWASGLPLFYAVYLPVAMFVVVGMALGWPK